MMRIKVSTSASYYDNIEVGKVLGGVDLIFTSNSLAYEELSDWGMDAVLCCMSGVDRFSSDEFLLMVTLLLSSQSASFSVSAEGDLLKDGEEVTEMEVFSHNYLKGTYLRKEVKAPLFYV